MNRFLMPILCLALTALSLSGCGWSLVGEHISKDWDNINYAQLACAPGSTDAGCKPTEDALSAIGRGKR